MGRFRAERLSDTQVINVLSLALSTSSTGNAIASSLKSLAEKPFSELLNIAREQMSEHSFRLAEFADLLGVSELTARRWFETTEDLPRAARHRLAGVCVLLSHAHEMDSGSNAAQQIRLAVSVARGREKEYSPDAAEAPSHVVASTFDAAGVAALALYTLLAAEENSPGRQSERHVRESEEVAEQS